MIYEFIIYRQTYYVPRAPSLCEARERQEVFKEHFDTEPVIVSPLEWELLMTKTNVLTFHVPDV
jgi:hypothetical protein